MPNFTDNFTLYKSFDCNSQIYTVIVYQGFKMSLRYVFMGFHPHSTTIDGWSKQLLNDDDDPATQ